MSSRERAVALLERIDETDLWDEFLAQDLSDEMIQTQYNLDEEDAGLVRLIIQSYREGAPSAYHYAFDHEEQFAHMIGEAMHQGFDGWTPYQRYVIEAFLADVAYACSIE